jgi:carbon-monoxide dehydrogenase small subunit
MDGEPVNSCLVLAVETNGHRVETIESLSKNGEIHPIQQAFVNHNAIQCGFCTPGMVMTAKAFLDKNPDPTKQQVKEAIVGNLCRCTGYVRIVDAIMDVAKKGVVE